MNKKRLLLLLFMSAYIGIQAQTETSESAERRPMKEYDITAFCNYSSFHPSQYILDNNWDILCFFRTPATLHKLRDAGINANKSQLRLLQVGGLLECYEENDSTIYQTLMPIFSKEQTDGIRQTSRAMADSLLSVNKKSFKSLIKLFERKGWKNQTYSLVFSALLDGYIWDDKRLVSPKEMTDHGTWTGAYWAMYQKRPVMKCGTNGYGPLLCNWSDSLGYWPSDSKLIQAAKDIMSSQKDVITDKALAEYLSQWGICRADGQIIVPVIRRGSGDDVDVLCSQISDNLCAAVRAEAGDFMKKYNIANKDEAEVILYHELMFDMLPMLEEQGLIKKPAILQGVETGKIHFGDTVFIYL